MKLLEDEVISKSAALQQWTEAAASLSEWFIKPQRIQLYADVVEPYLLGIAKVSYIFLLFAYLFLHGDSSRLIVAEWDTPDACQRVLFWKNPGLGLECRDISTFFPTKVLKTDLENII